jgi:hypothetical protein
MGVLVVVAVCIGDRIIVSVGGMVAGTLVPVNVGAAVGLGLQLESKKQRLTTIMKVNRITSLFNFIIGPPFGVNRVPGRILGQPCSDRR